MEIRTLTDVIKFVNEYWEVEKAKNAYYLIFGTEIEDYDNFTSSGDF